MDPASSPKCSIVVLASGNGSNFQALLDTSLPARSSITHLVVNRKSAFAQERAHKAGVPTTYFNLVSHGFQPKGERDPDALRRARERYDAALAAKVLELSPVPDLIVLAGWMHVFTPAFLDPVAKKGIEVINLHPALPGKNCYMLQ